MMLCNAAKLKSPLQIETQTFSGQNSAIKDNSNLYNFIRINFSNKFIIYVSNKWPLQNLVWSPLLALQ